MSSLKEQLANLQSDLAAQREAATKKYCEIVNRATAQPGDAAKLLQLGGILNVPEADMLRDMEAATRRRALTATINDKASVEALAKKSEAAGKVLDEAREAVKKAEQALRDASVQFTTANGQFNRATNVLRESRFALEGLRADYPRVFADEPAPAPEPEKTQLDHRFSEAEPLTTGESR